MTTVTFVPPADAHGSEFVRDGPGRRLTLSEVRRSGAIRGRLALLGPAFVAAVAYVDPGNVATNVASGARYGYLLLWVVVGASLMAVLVQYLSAKAGLATGRNLPELCQLLTGRRGRLLLWVQAEIVAMATDLAEFVGAAVALNLLFGVPLLPAGLITAVLAVGILAGQRRGHRPFEIAIAMLFAVIAAGFGYDLLAVGSPQPAAAAAGLVPRLAGPDSLLLAIGIVGATVMPHAVYLHSALTQRRVVADDEDGQRRLLRWLRLDCGLGLGLAGIVNVVILAVAANLFHATGHTDVDGITAAHAGLGQLAGGGAALMFAVALLASGLSSASVGTSAGQVIMQGFLRRHIPLYVRRLVTMVPALIVLAAGLPVTQTLVLSQVVLSFGIPFALVPLILVTRRRDLMGSLVNRRSTTVAAVVVAAIIIALNGYLIVSTVSA